MISFTVQKVLSLIKFHLFIFSFSFFSFALRDRSKKYCYDLWQKEYSPHVCSPKGFIYSGLTFTSLVHF